MPAISTNINRIPPYRLIRSRRKTVTIRILPDGCVEVRAPMRISQKNIEGFLLEKREWILQHVENNQHIQAQKESALKNVPDFLPLFGKDIPVKEGTPSFSGGYFYLPKKPVAELLPEIRMLYKRIAEEYLPGRTVEIQYLTGITPTGISIGSAKTYWGTCSGKNSIRFSFWLMAAPKEAIDGVILHELCHIPEHNHSNRFWALVHTYMPNYDDIKILLKHTLQKLNEAGLR